MLISSFDFLRSDKVEMFKELVSLQMVPCLPWHKNDLSTQ